MYSNKENINVLTALMLKHGVRHVVVCPGSRNAPLVHNFGEDSHLECHPVTDERSAGFLALGIALQDPDSPVAVCVTSGSAMLNLTPAVAEAHHRHCRLLVISADRPGRWIDQLDGQTIVQPGALGRFVATSVNLPEPGNDEERWHCNRLVNEAFIAMQRDSLPCHINVPVTEPLFDFTVSQLPDERAITYARPDADTMKRLVSGTRRTMAVLAQMAPSAVNPDIIAKLGAMMPVLYEPLAVDGMPACFTDQMLAAIGNDNSYIPDLVVYMGANTVSKRLRHFLRRLPHTCNVAMVDSVGRLYDVSMHTTYLLQGSAADAVTGLLEARPEVEEDYREAWTCLHKNVATSHSRFTPPYSSMLAVKLFEQTCKGGIVHYANSMAVRLGCIFAEGRHIHCNRGINGIEGSVSTAAGTSLATDQNVYCVTGDLSFFYDSNALWQQQLKGNLRILLLNNHCGAIFGTLPGLEASPVRDTMVAGGHNLSAEGICRQYGITYRRVDNADFLADAVNWLGTAVSDRPVLLEVVTDAKADSDAFEAYMNNIKK
ncbi:MAG: 2-succinyl-5-enolpyruvyl-6-hydroxy-3-cyclohexene-1-carboxylic-acid synthase [Bacteroidales bacterium]|nr:2-succinyl-5-enolpyruvyl-6-hydroxy-3-cyclohexene-1-carboxylic-acid synthase [Candidatus Sodaliphilus aphodohippi]